MFETAETEAPQEEKDVQQLSIGSQGKRCAAMKSYYELEDEKEDNDIVFLWKALKANSKGIRRRRKRKSSIPCLPCTRRAIIRRSISV